jgi:arginyl-tRNA synthetase
MASTRFKNVIAGQLAKLTGGDVSVIARGIDRPKIKGHGTFAIPLPRLLPALSSSGGGGVGGGKKKKAAGDKKDLTQRGTEEAAVGGAEAGAGMARKQDVKGTLLARIRNEASHFLLGAKVEEPAISFNYS